MKSTLRKEILFWRNKKVNQRILNKTKQPLKRVLKRQLVFYHQKTKKRKINQQTRKKIKNQFQPISQQIKKMKINQVKRKKRRNQLNPPTKKPRLRIRTPRL